MNLKKTKIISIINVIIISFLFHFVYSIFPNSIISIFVPVNESIWEHMKLLYTSVLLNGIIDYLLLTKYKIKHNNFFLALFASSILIIPIYLIIYLPFNDYGDINEILIFSTLIISIILSQIINYLIQKKDSIKYLNTISLILIIIVYIVFGYLTYHPIRIPLFFDYNQNKYGINIYKLWN